MMTKPVGQESTAVGQASTANSPVKPVTITPSRIHNTEAANNSNQTFFSPYRKDTEVNAVIQKAVEDKKQARDINIEDLKKTFFAKKPTHEQYQTAQFERAKTAMMDKCKQQATRLEREWHNEKSAATTMRVFAYLLLIPVITVPLAGLLFWRAKHKETRAEKTYLRKKANNDVLSQQDCWENKEKWLQTAKPTLKTPKQLEKRYKKEFLLTPEVKQINDEFTTFQQKATERIRINRLIATNKALAVVQYGPNIEMTSNLDVPFPILVRPQETNLLKRIRVALT